MRLSSRFILPISGVLLLALLLFLFLPRSSSPQLRTGQIEMRELDVASKIPGRITWIGVDEGDSVTMEQDLVRLSDRDVRAKAGQAEGAVDAARAQYRMALHGTRPEQVEMAERQYAAAKSQFDLAEKTVTRLRTLHAERLLSDQERDGAEQKYQAALSAMEAARAQRDMARSGARREEKEMARGQMVRAEQSLEEVRSFLDETVLRSPVAGIVAKRYADAGELVATGYPVLSILDPSDSWAELNIPAPDLEKIRVGMKLRGQVHGLGRSVVFRVSSIASMADFANWRAQNERGSFEVRSFTVKLRPESGSVPGLRPGMTVTFDLSRPE